jgi:subtilisin-like proprotein convertase family protein
MTAARPFLAMAPRVEWRIGMFSRAIVVALAAALLIPLGQGAPRVEAKSKTVSKTFSNSAPIDITTFQTHSSQIQVSGLKKGKLLDVDVVLKGFSHTLPDDVDVLVVAPDGRNAIILSDVGAANDATDLTITLDDEANQALPNDDPLSSGRFQPANYDGGDGDMFLNPNAPTPSGNVALSTFDGVNPNGAWTLYVYDDNAGDNGSIADGWSLQIKAKVKK